MRLRAEFLDGTVLDTGRADGWAQDKKGQFVADVRQIKEGHWAAFVESQAEPILPGGDQSAPRPVIRALGLSAPPGWLPYEGDLQGVRPYRNPLDGSQINLDGEDVWVAIQPGDKLPRHSQFPAGGYPLQGGTRLRFDFLAPGVELVAPMPHQEATLNGFLAWLGYTDTIGPGEYQKRLPPEVVDIIRYWTAGAAKGYSLNDWINRRFDDRVVTTGILGHGQVPWADIYCNHHYAMGDHCVLAWWLFQDPDAFTMFVRLARAHLQHGIYTGPGPYSYMHAAEKTGGLMEYPADSTPPTREHAWDSWLIFYAQLTQDPMALEIMRGRAAKLRAMHPADHWNGGGGSRILERALLNMQAFHVLGGEDFTAELNRVLDHAQHLDAAGRQPWTINDVYEPDGFSPWLDFGTLHRVILVCRMLGRDESWAMDKIRWIANEWVEVLPTGEALIPHKVTSHNNRQATYMYGDVAAAFALGSLCELAKVNPAYAKKRDACRKSAVGKLRIDETASIGGGPGWCKKIAEMTGALSSPDRWQ